MYASRASTATLGRDDDFISSGHSVATQSQNHHNAGGRAKRLIIAVDFGTTYSAVSYTVVIGDEPVPYHELRHIHSIENFPNECNWGVAVDMKYEVPTEVIYPLNPKFRKEVPLGPTVENDEHLPLPRDEAFYDGGYGNEDYMSVDDSTLFRWGYTAHEAWALSTTHSDPNSRALSRFKLLLDDSPKTEDARSNLKATLDELKRRRVVKDHREVIVDFLTCLLRHTKSELMMAGFDESYRKEMVLCVPAIWTQKACRDMQTAMAQAMAQANFEGVDVKNNSIENLFIVSEPEAAAAYILGMERDVSPGDTFVLLDAGGGTVDANTYTISMTTPLRLSREVVPPGGGLHGSSYINEGFRKLLVDLLKDETYLNDGKDTIDGCIEEIMYNEFEYKLKRSFDLYTARGVKKIRVRNLGDNLEKRFKGHYMFIPVEWIRDIFLTHLNGIGSIMEDQINAAIAKGARVEKVVLIGGFAASPSLRKYLEDRLANFNANNDCDIKLLPKSNDNSFKNINPVIAVAHGAVLRAVNKEQGPKRYARSSYGILRREQYNRDSEEHKGATVIYDPHDGLKYVKTVEWVLKLGHDIEPVWRCEPIECRHTFDCWPVGPLVCKEVLYVSDTSTESSYSLKHPKNKGTEKVGEIVVDFTFLRDQGLIHPVDGVVDEKGRRIGKRHYVVTFNIVIEVVDRDLQCTAIYDGRVREKCKINIAAAFRPGVK